MQISQDIKHYLPEDDRHDHDFRPLLTRFSAAAFSIPKVLLREIMILADVGHIILQHTMRTN